MNIIVNVSDMRASVDPGDTLVTYSLGSCIGVAAYDPVAKVGGLLHFQLPSASLDASRAAANPLMFGDSGMECLLRAMGNMGAEKRRLRITLAGGAQMMNDNNLFNIGRRNHASIRKVLWQHGLFVDTEDVGGTSPRNVYVCIADGRIAIKATERATVR